MSKLTGIINYLSTRSKTVLNTTVGAAGNEEFNLHCWNYFTNWLYLQ